MQAVLSLSVVDNSALVFRLLLGPLSHESGIHDRRSAPHAACHGPSRVRMRAHSPCFPRLSRHRSALARAEASAPRGRSSADWSVRQPLPVSVADSVAAHACRLGRWAAPAPRAMTRAAARNGSRPATSGGGPGIAALPGPSTTSGAPRQPRFAAASFLRRSINAVLIRPLSPNFLRAAVSSTRGEQRITCVTRTSFRRRYVFFTCP